MRVVITKFVHLIGFFCLLVMPFLITYHPKILPMALMAAATLLGVILLSICIIVTNSKIKINVLPILLSVIFLLLLLITFFNATETISRTRLFVYGVIVITSAFLGFNVDKKSCSQESMLKILMWAGVFIAGISLLIFYFSTLLGIDNFVSSNHVRMSGPIAQANLLAVSLFVAIGATLQLWLDDKITCSLAYAILFIVGYVFFGTLSRAILLGFVIFYGLILSMHGNKARKQLMSAGVVIAVASLLFYLCNDVFIDYAQAHSWIPNQEIENNYFNRSMLGLRLSEWHKAWILFLDNPDSGLGFEKYGANSVLLNYLPWAVIENSFPAHSHNIFFQLVAEFGLVGLLVAIALFVYSINYLINAKSNKLFILAIFFPFFINSNVEYVLWRVSFAAFIVFLLSYFDSSTAKYEFKIKKILLAIIPVFYSLLIIVTIPAYKEVLRLMNSGRINMDKLYEYSAHPIYGQNFSYAFVRAADFSGLLVNEYGYSIVSQELNRQLRLTPDPIIRFKAMQKAIYDKDELALDAHYQQMRSMFTTDESMLNFFVNECGPNQPLCNAAYEFVLNKVQGSVE